MINATKKATSELRRVLESLEGVTEQLLRLAPDPQGNFVLTVDIEREDDESVDDEGTKILVVDSDTSILLDGAVIDLVDTPEGPQLTLSHEADLAQP